MALFKADLSSELDQVKAATGEIIGTQLAPLIDTAIKQAGNELGAVVEKAGKQVDASIKVLSDEVHNQRKMTADEVKALIDYSAEAFGKALDARIEKAKLETADLITSKLSEIRGQLSDAANEQKRTALRNASVAVLAALLIGVFSLVYRKAFHGEIDLLAIFRAILASVAVGQAVWITAKLISIYLSSAREKKNLVVVGAQYFGVSKFQGAIWHAVVLSVLCSLWGILYFLPQIQQLLLSLIKS